MQALTHDTTWPPKPLELRLHRKIRGTVTFDWSRPNIFLPIGHRGSGKSSTLEAIGTHYAQKGPIIDVFSSWDNESLAWCKFTSAKILLVKGNNVDVDCSWETRALENLTLHDLTNYDVVIACPSFFYPYDDFYNCINKICWELLPNRRSWTNPLYLLGREISSLMYSRLQVVKDTQKAKSQTIEFLRQSRHIGVAVGVDTIRYTGVDTELRGVIDYIFIKGTGIEGLPRDYLRWVYSYIKPRAIDTLHPQYAVVISKQRPMGIFKIEYPWWHKEEKEDILETLDIKLEYNQQEETSADRRTKITVEIHKQIIELKESGKSYERIAKKTHLSPSAVGIEYRNHQKGECTCNN